MGFNVISSSGARQEVSPHELHQVFGKAEITRYQWLRPPIGKVSVANSTASGTERRVILSVDGRLYRLTRFEPDNTVLKTEHTFESLGIDWRDLRGLLIAIFHACEGYTGARETERVAKEFNYRLSTQEEATRYAPARIALGMRAELRVALGSYLPPGEREKFETGELDVHRAVGSIRENEKARAATEVDHADPRWLERASRDDRGAAPKIDAIIDRHIAELDAACRAWLACRQINSTDVATRLKATDFERGFLSKEQGGFTQPAIEYGERAGLLGQQISFKTRTRMLAPEVDKPAVVTTGMHPEPAPGNVMDHCQISEIEVRVDPRMLTDQDNAYEKLNACELAVNLIGDGWNQAQKQLFAGAVDSIWLTITALGDLMTDLPGEADCINEANRALITNEEQVTPAVLRLNTFATITSEQSLPENWAFDTSIPQRNRMLRETKSRIQTALSKAKEVGTSLQYSRAVREYFLGTTIHELGSDGLLSSQQIKEVRDVFLNMKITY